VLYLDLLLVVELDAKETLVGLNFLSWANVLLVHTPAMLTKHIPTLFIM
jgi:hypothetical protein